MQLYAGIGISQAKARTATGVISAATGSMQQEKGCGVYAETNMAADAVPLTKHREVGVGTGVRDGGLHVMGR